MNSWEGFFIKKCLEKLETLKLMFRRNYGHFYEKRIL